MTTGVRIWDASGNLIFDTPTIVFRYLGTIKTTAGTGGSVTDAGLSTGTPWWVIQGAVGTLAATGVIVSVSGTTLTWAYTGTISRNATIIYGVR
jgi:hypothetical protein